LRVRRIDDPEAVHPVCLYWRRSAPDAGVFEHLAAVMIAEKRQIRSERAARFQS
jgi:LysR family hydrogen peroxide-inducible transcriptional activator